MEHRTYYLVEYLPTDDQGFANLRHFVDVCDTFGNAKHAADLHRLEHKYTEIEWQTSNNTLLWIGKSKAKTGETLTYFICQLETNCLAKYYSEREVE